MARRFRRKKRFRRRRRKMPIVKLIKKVIQSQAEHKFRDLITPPISVTFTTPRTFIMNGLPEGTGTNARIGFAVKSSMLKIRYHIFSANSGVIANVRVYVIQNTTLNDPAVLPDVFGLFPRLEDSIVKYKVLYDRTHQISLGINEDIFVNKTFRRFPVSLKWDGPSNNDIVTGKIDLHVVSDALIADDITFGQTFRHTYTDI